MENQWNIERMIFKIKFPNEEFDPNDYNDWAKENEWEAYQLCLKVAKQLTAPKPDWEKIGKDALDATNNKDYAGRWSYSRSNAERYQNGSYEIES